VKEYRPLIRDIPKGERPRERLKEKGESYLSNAELLAILLRTGVQSESVLELATRLLAKFGGIEGLMRVSFEELCREHGVGEAKACQIKAALELGRRMLSISSEDRPKITSPQDAVNLVPEMGFLEQEELKVICLDSKNRVKGIYTVYKGNVGSSIIRSSEVFREAVKQNSPSIIILHNHPSGDPTPSEDDIEITKELLKAGRILNINLLDHIIVGRGKFVSLRERGIGEPWLT